MSEIARVVGVANPYRFRRGDSQIANPYVVADKIIVFSAIIFNRFLF